MTGMIVWNIEKEFVQYTMHKLKSVGFSPIRIESASTVSGMPDMYVLGYNDDYFIEFKNMKTKSIHDEEWKIQWRPGQQAWAQEYAAHHTRKVLTDFISTKYSWTFVGLKDGALLIRMEDYKQSNIVSDCLHYVFKFTKEEYSALNLKQFLWTHSQVVVPILHKNDTLGIFLNRQMRLILEEVLGSYYMNIDYPFPEDYIEEIEPNFTKDSLIQPLELVALANKHIMGWLERKVAEQAWSVYDSYIHNEVSHEKSN